ncbi:MAG TPA: nucleotidyltransferase family protein [Pyrinomonadaceae bacterium]|nr:nucleotidyltransferase family protein [Pyrinomonadaceae bacterium]
MSDELKAFWPFGDGTLRREHALLLHLCAHVGKTSSRGGGEFARSGSLDWEYVARLARRHAVVPLVYRALQTYARGAAPEPVRRALSEKYRANAARNVLLAGELLRVSRLFESEGVGALAYKGPALAVAAYGDLSLRRFVDLDVIVRERDLGRASQLLRDSGYAPQGFTPEQESALARTQHAVSYARDGGRLIVELHRDVSSKDFADVTLDDAAWSRATRVSILNGTVAAPSAEDLLLALCVHGTKHLWERLAWVCDMAGLVNSNPKLDWPAVFERGRAARVERMLMLGLTLARGLAGAEFPEEVWRKVREDETARRLASDAALRMFDGAEYRPAGFLRSVGFNLRARGRARERLRYFRFILTPTDGDLASLALPPRLGFVYYLLRPFRLLLKKTE